MASLLLAEDKLEEICCILDGIAGGAAPGRITAGKLRSLASSAHRAAARLQAFEDKQYNRAEQQAANKLFKQAVHMSSSDDSSDDDAATVLDQARRRAARGGQRVIQSEGYRRSGPVLVQSRGDAQGRRETGRQASVESSPPPT